MSKIKVRFLLIVAVFLLPMISAYLAFYFFQPQGRVNYGRLITPPLQAESLRLTAADGRQLSLSELKGQWVLLAITDDPRALATDRYSMRQAQLIQGREMGRIDRIVLGRQVLPSAGDEKLHGLASADLAAQLSRLSSDPNAIFIMDPLGNVMMAYDGEVDIKKMAKDLKRLLQASRIG